MLRIKSLIIALLLTIAALLPGYAQEPKKFAVAHFVFEKCEETETNYIPILDSDSASGPGVSGGGSFTGCYRYSYRMSAVRRGRKQIRVHLRFKFYSVSVEKDIIVVRGKKTVIRLADSVKIVLSY